MKKQLLYILLSGSLIYGCKKVDGPDNSVLTTSVVFNTSRDLNNLLYGAYSALGNDNVLSGYWKVIPELLADHVEVNVVEPIAGDPYKEVYDRNLSQAQYAQSWKLAYTAIQNVNCVLYAIDNKIITKETDAEFTEYNNNRIRGEAFCLRAMAYFELVRLYGHQYGYNSAVANSGVILRTQPVLNVGSIDQVKGEPRATVEDVYKLIISDLQSASLLIPPNNDLERRGRVSTYVASGYLARVYFQMNNYTKALEEINKTIGSVPGVMDRFALSRSPATGTITVAQAEANVFAAFNSSTSNGQVAEIIYDFVSVARYAVNGVISRKYLRTTTVQPHLSISPKFITDAAFVTNDARRSRFITAASGKNYTRKWDRALQNIPTLRSVELVLDRAEINAEIATTQPNGSQAHLDALADINMIRTRAIPSYVFLTPTTMSSTNILAEVRKERVRELAFEGDRLHNLRRMKANVSAGSRTGVTDLPWNSNKLLMKIPDAEVLISNGMVVQNPD